MRLSLLAFAVAVALTASGCDSTGLDDISSNSGCSTGCGGPTTGGPTTGGPTTGGPTTGGGTTHPGGGTPTTPPGGHPTPALTFAQVSPSATYLRAQEGTDYATAYRLSDFGIAPGNEVCFMPVGDYFIEDGVLASSIYGDSDDGTVATGAFSASDHLSAPTEFNRVKDVIDGEWAVATLPLLFTDISTDVDADFEASGCYPVPAGAAFIFFSAYDDANQNNTDALVDGQPFGIQITRGAY